MLQKLHKIKREKKTTCINTKKIKEEDSKREITDQRTIRKTSTKWQYKSFLFNSTLNVY